MLNPEIFAAADVHWGPHSIDRFSSFRTRQIPRFCSRWLNPCMEYLDAFTESWNNENNWLFPPPYIIPRVLKHLKSSSADPTLVAPLWRSALLTYDGVFFRHEVIDPQENMFIPAVPGITLFGQDIPNFRLLLLRLCFCKKDVRSCLRRLLSSLLTPILVSYPFDLNLLTLGYLVFFVGLGVSFSSLKNHKDHEIRYLVSELPSILLLDKAPDTVKRYFGAFQKWERWARSKCISSIPASPEFFPLFLISLIKTCSSFSAFNAVVLGVSWAHLKFGLTPPSAFPIAKQIVQAAKRIFGKAPRNRKLPLQRNHVRLLQDKFAFGDLAQLQIVTLITIGFAGFLRWDDLSRLKYSDLRFHSNYIAVFLEQRKNDQFREGSWIFIAASHSRYCPVILLQRFLSKEIILTIPFSFEEFPILKMA